MAAKNKKGITEAEYNWGTGCAFRQGAIRRGVLPPHHANRKRIMPCSGLLSAKKRTMENETSCCRIGTAAGGHLYGKGAVLILSLIGEQYDQSLRVLLMPVVSFPSATSRCAASSKEPISSSGSAICLSNSSIWIRTTLSILRCNGDRIP